jgi:outer membrane protein OmpA-like peptidoglycan-associated protein
MKLIFNSLSRLQRTFALQDIRLSGSFYRATLTGLIALYAFFFLMLISQTVFATNAIQSVDYTNDADKDGVSDLNDHCLETASGQVVNHLGCPQLSYEKITMDLNINFDTGSWHVPESAYIKIRSVADFLEQYPETHATIEGHTDEVGEANYNLELSQNRANEVERILHQRFNVPYNRLSAHGFGETRPIADNSSQLGQSKNRRVVASIETKRLLLRAYVSD